VTITINWATREIQVQVSYPYLTDVIVNGVPVE
jgi:hypothetical protein